LTIYDLRLTIETPSLRLTANSKSSIVNRQSSMSSRGE
jgi:hypothetical protein